MWGQGKMSYPYGKREKVKLLWQDANHAVQLKKASVVFEGSKKHCGEQLARWLVQKEFLDPIDLLKLSLKMDIRLFGRIMRMWEEEKQKTPETSQAPQTYI